MTSAPETGTDNGYRRCPHKVLYVKCLLVYPSDLMAIIDIDIHKNSLLRQVTATCSAAKTHEWSLDLSMTTVKLV